MAQVSDIQAVLEALPAPRRLAAAHAPASARAAWVAFLALDERLGRVAERASEPMLAQLRLAWWRDRLREPPERWPLGEPLLALLRAWEGELAALETLADGWESAVIDPDAADRPALADARIGALAALARLIGAPDDPERVASAARQWARATEGAPIRLSGLMRPLAILAAMDSGDVGFRAWLRIVRLGLLGR